MARGSFCALGATLLLLACGSDPEGAGGGGGGGGEDGGTGGGGGKTAPAVRLLAVSACTDYSGALDRLHLLGEDADGRRCLNLVLSSGSAGLHSLTTPTGWSLEKVELYDSLCDGPFPSPPLAAQRGEGDVRFVKTDGQGGPVEVSADAIFTFEGKSGPFRLNYQANRYPVSDCSGNIDIG